MRQKGSISTIVAAATFLAVTGCGSDDGTGEMTNATVGVETPPTEPSYTCTASVEQAESDSSGSVRIVEAGGCGYQDALGHVTYGLVVENTGDQPLTNVFVDVEAHDSSGTTHGRPVPHQIYLLPPGERMGVGYDAATDGATAEVVQLEATVRVQNDVDPWEDGGAVRVSDIATAVQGSQRTTTFKLTSTATRAIDRGVALYVVYRGADGAILGGDDGFVQSLDAGATIDQTITSTYVNPEVVEAEVYVNVDGSPPPP